MCCFVTLSGAAYRVISDTSLSCESVLLAAFLSDYKCLTMIHQSVFKSLMSQCMTLDLATYADPECELPKVGVEMGVIACFVWAQEHCTRRISLVSWPSVVKGD